MVDDDAALDCRTVLGDLGVQDLTDLGFTETDALETLKLCRQLLDDGCAMATVQQLACELVARIGTFLNPASAETLPGGVGVAEPGSDAWRVALAAMLCAAPRVVDYQVSAGIPPEIAQKSVSDLGQQVAIHRLVRGELGLGTYKWCIRNFTGRLLWLGRLQFTVEVDEGGLYGDPGAVVLSTHVPETGPLSPLSVDESLAMARTLAPVLCPQAKKAQFVLNSWLLDDTILAGLNPQSNTARFAQRFRPVGEREPGVRGALFFGFHIEPNLNQWEVDALPQETSLQRAIVAALRAGTTHSRAGVLRDAAA